MKRLLLEFDNPRAAGPLKDLIHSVSQDAQHLPITQRLAPRKSKPGTFDLTSSRLFVKNIRAHAIVVQCATSTGKTFPLRSGKIGLGPAVHLLLMSLHTMHRLWRQKTIWSDHDLTLYEKVVTQFGMIWHALKWNLVAVVNI